MDHAVSQFRSHDLWRILSLVLINLLPHLFVNSNTALRGLVSGINVLREVSLDPLLWMVLLSQFLLYDLEVTFTVVVDMTLPVRLSCSFLRVVPHLI